MIEASVVKKIRPAVARGQAHLTQQELSAITGVAQSTISSSERGGSIRITTAIALLEGINKKRAERGLRPLELDEVGWNVPGGIN